jgi:hypothetical protein
MCLVCEFGLGVFAAAAAMAPSLGRSATSSKLPERGEFVIKGAYVITIDDNLGEIENGPCMCATARSSPSARMSPRPAPR